MKAQVQTAQAPTGSVLVGMLWCLALLTLLVVGLFHTVRLDLIAAKNHGDQVQAQYLALAGIEKAKALLHRDARDRQRSAQNHNGALEDAPELFQDVPLGRGQYRVFHLAQREQGGGLRFGVRDEESRLHLNRASPEELGKLYGMPPEILAAILDWRDSDHTVTAGGAEAEHYANLQPPSLPRDGPFQTVRELLMVRGMTPELCLGEDANFNGLLDLEENDGRDHLPPDNADGVLDGGWAESLTVHSRVRNQSASGQQRVDVQTADERTLTGVRGITPEIARAIVAYRGQNKLESLADLLEVTAPSPTSPRGSIPGPPGAPQVPPQTITGGPVPARPTTAGPRVIDEALLIEIADDITTSSDLELPGLINLNTASATVLGCLPGFTPQLAQAVVAYRKSAGYFPNIAAVLKVDGMNRQIFKQIAPKVSARSETCRILSEGTVPSSGARKRIEVIVWLGTTRVETLAYREDAL